MKRLPARGRARSGEGGGGAEDEVSLTCVGRGPDLGHVSRRPPDGGGLGLRGAGPGEYEQYEQRVASDSLGSSAAAATTMFGFPVLTARANLETACPCEVIGGVAGRSEAPAHSDASGERTFALWPSDYPRGLTPLLAGVLQLPT